MISQDIVVSVQRNREAEVPLHSVRKALRGPWRWGAYLLWASVFVLTLSLFAMGIVPRFRQLLQDAANYSSALENLGLSTRFIAVYLIVPDLAVMAAFAFIAVVVFWRNTQDWLMLFFSLTLVTVAAYLSAPIFFLPQTPLVQNLSAIVWVIALSFSFCFFYLFPDGRFVPSWTRFLCFAWLGWAALAICFPRSFLSPVTWDQGVLLAFEVVGYGVGIFAQVYRYFRVSSFAERRYTRWIMLGTTSAMPAWIFIGLLNSALEMVFQSGIPRLLYLLASPMLFYLPLFLLLLSIMISAWHYRLWNLDFLINRGLVYTTLTVILGGVYFLEVFFITLVIRSLFGQPNNTLVVFVATLGTALAFAPLRQRVQSLIDRAFYRTKVNYQALVTTLSARLSSSLRLDQITTLLTEDLPREAQVAWADLSVVDSNQEDMGALVCESAGQCRFAEGHPLVRYFQRAPQPVLRLQAPPDMSEAAADFLDVHDIALSMPLVVRNKLVGIYSMGEKLSGGLYSPEEIRLLEMLGQQAAVAVENARLYQQVESYSQTLEMQVQSRTQELEAAYRDLAEQHAKLDVILQNIADGLVVTDLDGQVVMVNPAFEQMLARSQRLFIGQPLEAVLPDTDLLATVKSAAQAAPAIVTVDVVWRSKTFRASACALQDTSEGVDSGALASGVVTVLRDITHEVEVAKMKDDFVSMVTHELRTPMTSVLGFSKLIQKQFARHIEPRLVDEAQVERIGQRILSNLDIIVSEGERLTRLINDVLDVAKMEAGRIQWEHGDIIVSEMVKGSVAAIHSLSRQRGIPVKIEIAENLPVLNGDRDRLVQVVTNLLSNALKFTDEGHVLVSARLIMPGTRLPAWGQRYPTQGWAWDVSDSLVLVEVQDTGIGIAESDLPKVFEKFRQVGNRSSGTRRPGTGLGLPICKEIVEHHGGRLWVDSRLGEGSRFCFTLPLSREPLAQG